MATLTLLTLEFNGFALMKLRLAEAKQSIKTIIKNQKLKQQSDAIQLSLF